MYIPHTSISETSQFLDFQGQARVGRFSANKGLWEHYYPQHKIPELDSQGAYFATGLPVDIHCHGVGMYDFTEIPDLVLQDIETTLKNQGIYCVLTLYLVENYFDVFLQLMREFETGQLNGDYTHILGFALEGPLLSSIGGTPRKGVWAPSRRQWEKLAIAGSNSLHYVILSPDACVNTQSSNLAINPGSHTASPEEIVQILVEADIRPAFGHFKKNDPLTSARATQRLIDLANRVSNRRDGEPPVITDHLMNDMPSNIIYAWRSSSERQRRQAEIEGLGIDQWTMENIEQRIGIIPTTLIRAAREGALVACMNFDGDHVDLEICKGIVKLIGTKQLIAMTDRIEGRRLAGRKLQLGLNNSLLYQNEGIVAAGSKSLDSQMCNMRLIGLTETDIWQLVCLTPMRIMNVQQTYNQLKAPRLASLISKGDQDRYMINCDENIY